MLFSTLIELLQKGESKVQSYEIANDPEIIAAESIEKATKNQISFLEKDSYLLSELNNTNSGALILPNQENLREIASNKNISWVVAEEPRIAFAEALEAIIPQRIYSSGIDKSAVIGDNVQLGSGVFIGANVSIADGSEIRSKAIIHPGVVIYEKVTIGENSELHANCVIHENSNIGNNCIINSNAVIGSEGFGFIPTKKGWRKMPQTGLVILKDNVEIGSGSTVDRPVVGETVIGAGTKIDNLVQIGHGVEIGNHCAMASQVGIAGGAKIGDGVILAGQVGVANRVTVGSNVIASSKCGIHTDIEPGQIISGFPAIPNKLWLRCYANFKKLPEIAKAIKKLSSSV